MVRWRLRRRGAQPAGRVFTRLSNRVITQKGRLAVRFADENRYEQDASRQAFQNESGSPRVTERGETLASVRALTVLFALSVLTPLTSSAGRPVYRAATEKLGGFLKRIAADQRWHRQHGGQSREPVVFRGKVIRISEDTCATWLEYSSSVTGPPPSPTTAGFPASQITQTCNSRAEERWTPSLATGRTILCMQTFERTTSEPRTSCALERFLTDVGMPTDDLTVRKWIAEAVSIGSLPEHARRADALIELLDRNDPVLVAYGLASLVRVGMPKEQERRFRAAFQRLDPAYRNLMPEFFALAEHRIKLRGAVPTPGE